ncbi:MAG: aminotransferase class IV [Clostridia bacterium]
MLSFNDNNAPYLIVNSELIRSDALADKERETIELPFDGPVIYEVIRYINGRGLFLEDHFQRLESSFRLQGIENAVDLQAFSEYASILLSVNEEKDCNVKIMSTGKDFVVYLSKKFYPGAEYYKNGIPTACIQIERPSPNAKVRRSEYVERIESFKQANEIFEALLMNAEGYLTEGSKSNLFFVKKDEPDVIYTAPSEMILEGIMRKYVLALCAQEQIEVRFEPVKYSALNRIEALFITGTSINVLPIAKVDEIRYNSPENNTVLRIMSAFQNYIDKITKG